MVDRIRTRRGGGVGGGGGVWWRSARRGGEFADEGREGLRVDAAVAERDEEGEGVAVKARLQDVRHLERQLQRLLRVPRCLSRRFHRHCFALLLALLLALTCPFKTMKCRICPWNFKFSCIFLQKILNVYINGFPIYLKT